MSIWEIAIKNGLARSGASAIGVTTHHVCEVERLPHIHRDPFDRLLVAQARIENLRFVTHDRMLAGYGDHVLIV